jgi:hypothetical protein
MYNRQRPHIYYGGENFKYYLTPSPADFLTRRAALRTNSIGPQPSHKGEGGSLLNLLKSMVKQNEKKITEIKLCKDKVPVAITV